MEDPDILLRVQTKQVVQVYEYVDIHIPTLMRMYKKRLKGYEAIGYTIQNGNEK